MVFYEAHQQRFVLKLFTGTLLDYTRIVQNDMMNAVLITTSLPRQNLRKVISANRVYFELMKSIKTTVEEFESCGLFTINPDATSNDVSSKGFYLKLIEIANNHCVALTAYQMAKQSGNPTFITQMVKAENVVQSFRLKAKTHYV